MTTLSPLFSGPIYDTHAPKEEDITVMIAPDELAVDARSVILITIAAVAATICGLLLLG